MTPAARAALSGILAAAGLTLAACRGAGSAGAPTPAAAPAGAAPIDTVGLPRIRFARGLTSGILDDSLPAGATRSYVLEAKQGQVMLAHAIAWPVAERLHPPPEPFHGDLLPGGESERRVPPTSRTPPDLARAMLAACPVQVHEGLL